MISKNETKPNCPRCLDIQWHWFDIHDHRSIIYYNNYIDRSLLCACKFINWTAGCTVTHYWFRLQTVFFCRLIDFVCVQTSLLKSRGQTKVMKISRHVIPSRVSNNDADDKIMTLDIFGIRTHNNISISNNLSGLE